MSPLCLPREPYSHPGEGVGVLVQGWGENLLGDGGVQVTEVTVNIRSKRECDHRFSQVGPENKDAVTTFLPKLTSSELFCADSSLDSQAGTCHGDSGGPAVIRLEAIDYIFPFFHTLLSNLALPAKVTTA